MRALWRGDARSPPVRHHCDICPLRQRYCYAYPVLDGPASPPAQCPYGALSEIVGLCRITVGFSRICCRETERHNRVRKPYAGVKRHGEPA